MEEMTTKDDPKARKMFIGGLPPSLTEEKDLIVLAKTGFGRTGAFVLPILQELPILQVKYSRCLFSERYSQ
ncbi:hypothetical protein ZEAMMB73_Zm00001d043078 [Zea mays]|uniref:Uncharacterized protein n=1 Tax=Zea mays TaxID=4577 RepID=A0A1D6N8G3_MAIZE|nr:hypothetical protein ZEAMMB73_Zm00001d043078 [Zea mays]